MENMEVSTSSDGSNGVTPMLVGDGVRHDDGIGYLVESVCEKQENEVYRMALPCFGCGIGWFSFILGFIFPLLWYFATILYLRKYHLKDPRERPGLAASAIAALICSVAVIITLLAMMFDLT